LLQLDDQISCELIGGDCCCQPRQVPQGTARAWRGREPSWWGRKQCCQTSQQEPQQHEPITNSFWWRSRSKYL